MLIQNGRITVECEGTGALDFQVDQLPSKPFAAVEYHDSVAAGAPLHSRLISSARTLDQNLHCLSNLILITHSTDAIHLSEQLGVTLLDQFLRSLDIHPRRRGIAARGVLENKRIIELDLPA